MKRLILVALIPAIVGCAALTKEQNRFLGAAVGAIAGYQLSKDRQDHVWAIVSGAATGALFGNYGTY